MKLNHMEKLPGEGATEYALRTLRSNILHLSLEPGERISVAEISQEMNISRTPVQNAFTRLSEEAMLKIIPQSGTYVSMIDMKRVYESVCLRNLMDQTVLYRLCESGITPKELYMLKANLNEQDFYSSQGDFIKSLALDTQFHQLFYQLCHMDSIYNAMQTIAADQCRVRMLKLMCKLRNKTTEQEHLEMLEAIKNRDVAQSHAIASRHLEGFAVDLESVHAQYSSYFSNWEQYGPEKFLFRSEEFRNLI